MLRKIREGYGRLQKNFPDKALSFRIEHNDCNINYKYQNSDYVKNVFIHNMLPSAFYCPQIKNQSQYAGEYIKRQEVHCMLSFFDNFIAMPKNDAVMAMPIEKVSHGILPVAAGTNAPTTKEANRIFAPSRKNSGITLRLDLSTILNKVYYQVIFLSRNNRDVLFGDTLQPEGWVPDGSRNL